MDEALKQKAIQYMGGECVLCGYKRCFRALHFHHINPFEKEFNISEKSSWIEIKQELKKCVLLCCICHNEYHSGLVDNELLVKLAEK